MTQRKRKRPKNRAAVSLGRKSRLSLSPERRKEIARMGADAANLSMGHRTKEQRTAEDAKRVAEDLEKRASS